MKTEELTALGISEENATKILAINGKDIEHAKATVGAAKDREIETLTAERDGLQSQLDTANATLDKFKDIDPEQIQTTLADYKDRAEKAEAKYAKDITARDQKAWLTAKLDEYGVKSPLARRQIVSDVMDEENGLKWKPGKDDKPGAFFGFNEYMKAAKEEDNTLYLTAEEKAAAEKKKELEDKKPKFTDTTDDSSGGGGEKYVPPKIF